MNNHCLNIYSVHIKTLTIRNSLCALPQTKWDNQYYKYHFILCDMWSLENIIINRFTNISKILGYYVRMMLVRLLIACKWINFSSYRAYMHYIYIYIHRNINFLKFLIIAIEIFVIQIIRIPLKIIFFIFPTLWWIKKLLYTT